MKEEAKLVNLIIELPTYRAISGRKLSGISFLLPSKYLLKPTR
jgi:hypothetical protein